MNEQSIFKEVGYENIQSEDSLNFHLFTEITPLDQEIDDTHRKDLSSIPISDIDLPEIVYIIVSDKIDLETKLLKDYLNGILSESELVKTLEIFIELKMQKDFANPIKK